MSTLLLRLASPLQSWGSDSKFERRTTQREPTKSGIIGFLAAALGRSRDESLDDLVKLNVGVRIDQPGQILKDFHTACKQDEKKIYVTTRYYLMDAVFLVGLEGDENLLRTLNEAVLSPYFPLYLGRRSCPPTGKISLGIRFTSLEQSLRNEPWQAAEWYIINQTKKKQPVYLTLVLDSKQTSPIRRRDIPISFSQEHRQFTYRYINDIPDAVAMGDIYAGVETKHDAFEEAGG